MPLPRPRKLLATLWSCSALVLIILLAWPINTRYVRLGVLIAATIFLVLLPVIAWPSRPLRYAVLSIYAATAIFLSLPLGKQPDPARLETTYISRLDSYTGTNYLWGGENGFGIDCSGLVRRALIETLLAEGLKTLNPLLIRQGISLWWHDTTAKNLGDTTAGQTISIASIKSLKTDSPSQLRPGDLAVTKSGIHVLAYLGDNTWIAADPEEQKVIRFTVPETTNGYFSTPVNIVRWKFLP